MSEQDLLDIFVKIAVSIISFKYFEKFLIGKYEDRKRTIIIWTVICALGQIFAEKLIEDLVTYNRFVNVILLILLFVILQHIFFEKSRARQIFVISSFIAGWEILTFTASPLAHAIFSAWSPLWEWSVNKYVELFPDSTENILSILKNINRVVVFVVIAICRTVQIALLILYLRLICRAFLNLNYELKFRDSLFLIFPCLTVFMIDFTVRLLIFSTDNGSLVAIYDRVPAIVLLLPLVSLLLLGIIISSVILFQNFVQYKDEEQKRLLLENSIVEMHKQIEDLQNIYDDMRGLRHDLRDHITNIAAYLKTFALENIELENYLKSMTNTIEKLNFADHTGNPITDIIIHQAHKYSIKHGIKFFTNFTYPQNFKIDVYDISVILNNSLKNAIEACEKVNDHREIEIKSYNKGNLFFIEVENTFDGKLNWNQENLPMTNKSDKYLHGIGLTNIKKCAQKYLGDIEITIKHSQNINIFNLIVMLYKKSDI